MPAYRAPAWCPICGNCPHVETLKGKSMPRTNKLSSYCTTVASDEHGTHVTYHQTAIVSFNDSTITLRTGGWDTVTTRRKMNQAARQFGLDYGVYREKGETFVKLPGRTWDDCKARPVPLVDGMSFSVE